MKKPLLFFLILFLISEFSFAQSSVWKVSKKGSTVYIGGTIHLLREQDYPLPGEFDMAYEESSVLVFETNMEEVETPAFQQKLISKSFFPGDSTLQNVLVEETIKLLEEECAELGLPFAQLQKLRPSVLIITLVAVHYQKMGINAPGVDTHFSKRGSDDGKESLHFESVDEQINLILNMGKGHEDEFVLHSLEDLQKVEEELLDLISSWENGSSEENVIELEEMKKDFPQLYEELVLARNNAWMPQIEAFFASDEIEFILVGNLHLHGSDGLLEQLKSKGYRIKQLKAK